MEIACKSAKTVLKDYQKHKINIEERICDTFKRIAKFQEVWR